MSILEDDRPRYEHDVECTKEDDRFTEPNERGLRTCLDCAGIFDADGKGVAVQDRRFDANYIPPPNEED